MSVLILSYILAVSTKNANFYIKFLNKYGTQFIFILASLSLVGSMILSLAFTFPPCDLCWYQRIFMYPIAFTSGISLYRKDLRGGAIYSIVFAIIGGLIALYHYLLQMTSFVGESAVLCSPTAGSDCSVPEFVKFGFVTIPFVSLIVFIVIIISSIYVLRKN